MRRDLDTAWCYCEAKCAMPGSDWYYALLHAPTDIKQASLALLALEADWHAISLNDAEPAQLKITWWQQQLATDQVSHPALQLLQPVATRFGLQNKLLSALFAATLAARTYRFDSFAELQHAAYNTVSAPLLIGLYVLQQPQLATALHELVFSLQLLANNHAWSWHIRHGSLPFAEADLRAYDLDPAAPGQWVAEARLKLLNHYHQQAHKLYQQALPTLAEHVSLRPLLRYARIQMYLAKRLKKDGFPATGLRLSPIRKLWLTWFF